MDDGRTADELIGRDYLSAGRAARIISQIPESQTDVVNWVRALAVAGDWRRFDSLVNLAAYIRPPDLASSLSDLVVRTSVGPNFEDIAEILGELGDPVAADSLMLLLARSEGWDAPYFGFGKKCVTALGQLDSDIARGMLRALAVGDGPKPIRWFAAYELEIEEELGFDEDEMMGYS